MEQLIACLQGYGVAVGLENSGNLMSEPGMSLKLSTVSLVAEQLF